MLRNINLAIFSMLLIGATQGRLFAADDNKPKSQAVPRYLALVPAAVSAASTVAALANPNSFHKALTALCLLPAPRAMSGLEAFQLVWGIFRKLSPSAQIAFPASILTMGLGGCITVYGLGQTLYHSFKFLRNPENRKTHKAAISSSLITTSAGLAACAVGYASLAGLGYGVAETFNKHEAYYETLAAFPEKVKALGQIIMNLRGK